MYSKEGGVPGSARPHGKASSQSGSRATGKKTEAETSVIVSMKQNDEVE